MPRYHQIARLLRQRAAAGPAGFTEHGLCAEFGVSRTTIRQALELLKRDGMLRSRRGVGSRIVSELPAARLNAVDVIATLAGTAAGAGVADVTRRRGRLVASAWVTLANVV